MILSFKPQFVKKILTGEKTHTIREDKHNRWKPNATIHFATGVRTKKYEQFYEAKCLKVDNIEIIWDAPERTDFNSASCVFYKNRYFSVIVNGRKIGYSEIVKLAKNDGFDDVSDFADWFNKNFKGKIIHWKKN